MPTRFGAKTSAPDFWQSVDDGVLSRLPRQNPSLQVQTIDGLIPGVPSVARMMAHDVSPDIEFGDWDTLFHAVKQRLTRIATTANSRPKPVADQVAVQIRTDLLECVAALAQLHATVTVELARRETLELELLDAKASLAQIRASLLGTQEGERRALTSDAHDSLTLLPNRDVLVERISHALGLRDSHHRFALMFLNLDGFKPFNDAHGQTVGDEMLQIVAARLRRVVRAQDLVSRVGGDEFACLIRGLTACESLSQLADKIAGAISAPCVLSTSRLTVRVSIGIAISPSDGSSAETLLEKAEQAMVEAKQQQVRYAFISPDGASNWPALRSPTPERPQQLPEPLS